MPYGKQRNEYANKA
ncbi:unnamed protein product [Victoria cruziana]